jgi:transglutaminase-like putative cysteine protease
VRRPRVEWPGDVTPALLAALTTWVSLWSWRGFVADPSGYLDPMLAVVVLVAVTGIALRAIRLPAVLVLLGQATVSVLWLTHLWAPEEALSGWIPTTSSLQVLGTLLGEGVVAAQSYAAPVPQAAPQIHALLVVAGASVALLVDFIAVGLRHVPVSGLPLLAVYTAPVSILDEGVVWWVFAAGAVGFLSLVANDEARRIERWGRALPRRGTLVDTAGGLVRSTSLRGSARRIGLTATTLAVAAPLVIPTLSGGLLPGPGSGGDGSGGSVTITNPMVNLRRDLVRGANVELLRVRTTSDDPSYLRVSVLDTFNGHAWKPSERDIPPEQQADGLLPRPPGLDPGTGRRQVEYDISVEETFESTWLPTPYPVTSIDVPGDWRYDADTFDFVSAVDDQGVAGLEYSLSALEVTPDPSVMIDARPAPASVFTPYTELPDDMSDTVGELARAVTAGLDTRYHKAVRLQSWFRDSGEFTYSLDRDPGTGAGDLEAFLSGDGPDSRVGYCEQFAASMALMGRTLGIPSRVAVGFLRPDRIGRDTYVYRAHDLHAWPEMYFEGAGWLRFEPTPGDRAPDVPGYTTGSLNTPEPESVPSASASPRANPRELNEERLRGDQVLGGTGEDDSSGGGVGYLLPGALGLAALLLAPWLVRTALRRWRWAAAATSGTAAEAGWCELRDTALDLRLPWNDSVTLRTGARTLASTFGRTDEAQSEGRVRGGDRGAEANPRAAAALGRLVVDVERARYARDTSGVRGRPLSAVREDVEICADALRAGTVKKWRRAATWLPASLWRNGGRHSGVERSKALPSTVATSADRAY